MASMVSLRIARPDRMPELGIGFLLPAPYPTGYTVFRNLAQLANVE
jgi:hypothetical protein